ncbi:T9SS type A sorting domain-containing protein [Flavobacteriales bacterium]|nr:T9SS type A sorting domain-containing protein [Flavobacteriales bacterium]
MKKIVITLTAVLLIGGIQAQNSLSILNLETDVWGSVETVLMQAGGTIENTNGTAPIAVRAERITIDTVPGTQNYFCWEQCYEPPTSVSPTTITLNPGQRMESFYADYKPLGIAGVSTLAYCFYDDANVTDSVCRIVRFTASPLGVQDVFLGGQSGISESYPNPAKTVANINYALKIGWGKAQIEVFSMLGSKVKKVALKQDQGTLKLDVANLPSGIYFYTLKVDGNDIATKKMLVTK